MNALLIFTITAVLEIAGCFAVWGWARQGASALWLGPGLIGLVAFAWLLTRIDTDLAGRAYAAYGGIYIAASLAWMWVVEGKIPDGWDMAGGAITIIGAMLIIYGPRHA